MSDSNEGRQDTPFDQGLAYLAAIVLCCLIVGFLSYSVGREGERDGQRAAEYERYGKRRQSVFCAGFDGNQLAQCKVEQEQAAREAYQAERDLEAQREMSLWALAMVIVSAITAGLTLWALIYVKGTLVATREALKDTGKATKAIIRQNEIAEAGQRPWLNFEVLPLMIGSGELWIMSAELTITNPTNFPAHAVSAFAVGHYFVDEGETFRGAEHDRNEVIERLGGANFRAPTTAFPSQPTKIRIPNVVVYDPGDVLQKKDYEPLGIMTFGLRYLFDGKEGWTFNEYVIAGRPTIDISDQTIRQDGSVRMANRFELHLVEAT